MPSREPSDRGSPGVRDLDRTRRGRGAVFPTSLAAGGERNLTAADFVIHMDPWWNPAAEDHASDRAHRIGQTRPVTIYRLVAKGTIEERSVALQHHKPDLAEQLLEGADTPARLDDAEFLNLLHQPLPCPDRTAAPPAHDTGPSNPVPIAELYSRRPGVSKIVDPNLTRDDVPPLHPVNFRSSR